MHAVAKAPLGQPVKPQPDGEQFIPQPLEQEPPSVPPQAKRLLMLAGVGLAILLLSGGLVWWLSQGAKQRYTDAAASYRQNILQLRDGMNDELDRKKLSGSDTEARPIFEHYGKQLEQAAAHPPKKPAILGVIPVAVTNDVETLTKATNNYAAALRRDYATYQYYTAVTTAFQPIRDLGAITLFDNDKVQSLAALWPTFLTALTAVKPPADLRVPHADIVKQTTDINEKITELAASFSTNSAGTNDNLLGQISPLTKNMNDTFVNEVAEASRAAFESVNNTYNMLDAALKNT